MALSDLSSETITVPAPFSELYEGRDEQADRVRRDRALASIVLHRNCSIQQAADMLTLAYSGLDSLAKDLVEGEDPVDGVIRTVKSLDGIINGLLGQDERR